VLEGGGRIDQASSFGDSLPDAPGPLIIVAVRGIQQTVTVIPVRLFAQPAGVLLAVGTPIAERPPHRSERAQFGHSAPTSGV
jgi:hypothetical protein